MFVVDKLTGEVLRCEVERLKSADFKNIKKSDTFDFDWMEYKDGEVYKIVSENSREILGLMHIIDQREPMYDYLEIVAIEVSRLHRGSGNGVDRIAGCLFGFAAQLSQAYGHEGFIGLVAKNRTAPIFERKYGFRPIGSMAVFGVRMISDTSNSIRLVSEFINKEIPGDA